MIDCCTAYGLVKPRSCHSSHTDSTINDNFYILRIGYFRINPYACSNIWVISPIFFYSAAHLIFFAADIQNLCLIVNSFRGFYRDFRFYLPSQQHIGTSLCCRCCTTSSSKTISHLNFPSLPLSFGKSFFLSCLPPNGGSQSLSDIRPHYKWQQQYCFHLFFLD